MAGRTNPYTRPVGVAAAVGWAIGLFLLFGFALAALGAIRPGADLEDVNYVLVQAASALLLLYAFARVHAPNAPLREVVGARPIGFASGLLAALMGGAAVIPINALQAEIARRHPISDDRAAEITHALAAIGRNERIAGVIATALALPIVDELIFRGALATGVSRVRGRGAAFALSAALYALFYASGDLAVLPVYLAIGLVLATARFGSGSLIGAIVAHLTLRVVDHLNDFRVAHTIDPLVVTTYPYPAYSPALVAITSAVTLAAGLLLVRFGRSEERDADVPLPPPAAGTPQADPEDDDS